MTLNRITIAHACAVETVNALQRALETSDPVEALLILKMIEGAAALRNDLAAVASALREKEQ